MELEETLLHYLQAGRLCTNRQKLGWIVLLMSNLIGHEEKGGVQR
jgi:hypothetical protein